MLRIGLLRVLSVVAIAMLPAAALAETNVLFIFDTSGSMKRTVEGGQTRMTVAKRAMSAALKDMPKEARLGLMLYGHRRAKDCKDIETVSSIGVDDADTLVRRIEALQPKGETPIAAALEQAVRSFAALKGQNNQIVLVTDGIEECGDDPCAAVRLVVALGLGVKAHIVGFTLDDKQRAAIECITKETGGRYFAANNTISLRDALAEVKKEVTQATPAAPPAPPKPVEFNLLAKPNGGQMLAAPFADWDCIISGADEAQAGQKACMYTHGVPSEAVFAFKGERPATFDTCTVLIPTSYGRDLKEFEVLAGDDLAGEFRSLGTFQTQNVRLMKTPVQEFKLPETTARYFKFRVLSTHGDTPL